MRSTSRSTACGDERALERVRQQHGVDGVAGDGELLGVADEIGGDAGPPVDERAALRARVAQERVAGAPGADLQQLLAEDSFQSAAHEALLVGEAAPPERRREPFLDRGRFAAHVVDPA